LSTWAKAGPEGLFIDVLETVAERREWDLEYRFASWDAAFRAVEAGELDLLPVVAFSEERAQRIEFSQRTLVTNWGEIYARRGLDIASITDLQDLTIAYMENDTHSQFFRLMLATLGVGHTSLIVDSYPEMLSALEDGRAAAGVFNHVQASIATAGRNVCVTPMVFNPIEIRYATPKGDPEGLLADLDGYIRLIRDGDEAEYRKLIWRWFGADSDATIPGWVWGVTIAGLAATIVVLGVNLWLRRIVHSRTEELRASNRALKESESRYRTILSSAMDGFIRVDQAGKVLEANEAYQHMSGYGIDELIGMEVSDLDAIEGCEAVIERLTRVTEQGYERFESSHRRKDGTSYDVEISLQYHPDNREYLVSFVRDISERKRSDTERMQTERAIRKQAEYQRAIFDYSPLAMFSMDLEGRVLSCNAAAERVFGWSANELQGRRLPTIPTDQDDEFLRLIGLLNSGNSIDGLELIRKRSDGTVFPVSLWSAPVYDADKRIIGIISYYEDISNRKAIEQRMAKSLEEKQILLREVHHRVKNNLSVISSLLNLQSATITDPEQAIEAFRNSRDRVMAMAQVHIELYESGDFSRIDMGTYIGNLTRQIALVHEDAERVSLTCYVDSVMLNLQVAVPCGLILNELITNAYKYARREDSQSTIRVSMTRTLEGRFMITVVDNGPGLPPGYEASDSLGLTLVRLLVDQIDGAIDMESSGSGTTIRVGFPDPEQHRHQVGSRSPL
jgi:PAS domain S-box-containing protein